MTMELLTTPTKAQCAAVNLSPPTRHISPLYPAPPPHTSTLFFLFHAKAWNELARLCLSGLVRQRIRGWGLGSRGLRYRGENFWQTMGKTPCFGDGALRVSGGYDELRLTAVCYNRLLDFERRFQSHPQPLLNAAAPLFLMLEPPSMCFSSSSFFSLQFASSSLFYS